MPTSTNARSWRDLLAEHFVDLDVLPDADGALPGEVRSRAVGSLQLSRVRSVDQRALRTAGLARSDPRRYVQVGLVEQGAARVQQDGRECWLRPGDYTVYETDRPFTWELRADRAPAWSLLVLTWCRPAGAAPVDRSTARRMDGASGFTGVVGRMLTDLVRSPDVVGTDPGDRLADELLDLVGTAAGAAPPEPAGTTGADRALLAAVRAHVEEHLADPALDPAPSRRRTSSPSASCTGSSPASRRRSPATSGTGGWSGPARNSPAVTRTTCPSPPSRTAAVSPTPPCSAAPSERPTA